MSDRFRKAYRPLDQDAQARLAALKDRAEGLESAIVALGPSRAASIALTKLEEAVMWATKAATAAPPDTDPRELVG